MKNRGKILPGETVRTLFAFNSNATVGAVTEAWELSTIPRANIALDGDRDQGVNTTYDKKSLNEKANKLHPLLLSALTASSQIFQGQRSPVEYDMLTPLQICIRGHTKEIDENFFNRQKTADQIHHEIEKEDIHDSKQLISRRIREPVKMHHIRHRKIKLFEKINAELFESLSGERGLGIPLLVTIDRMNLFESICDRVCEELPRAQSELSIIQKNESLLIDNNTDSAQLIPDEELGTVLVNRNPKELKRMFLELFPERKIVRSIGIRRYRSLRKNLYRICLGIRGLLS